MHRHFEQLFPLDSSSFAEKHTVKPPQYRQLFEVDLMSHCRESSTLNEMLKPSEQWRVKRVRPLEELGACSPLSSLLQASLQTALRPLNPLRLAFVVSSGTGGKATKTSSNSVSKSVVETNLHTNAAPHTQERDSY